MSRPVRELATGSRGAGIRMFGASGSNRSRTDEQLLQIDAEGPPGARLALDTLSIPEGSARWTVWGPVAGLSRQRALDTKASLLKEPDSQKLRANVKDAFSEGEIEPKPGHPWERMIGQGTMGLGQSWMWMGGDQMMALFRRHTQTLGEHAAIIQRTEVRDRRGRRVRIPTRLFPIVPTWLKLPEDHEQHIFRVGFDTPVLARDMHWFRRPGMENPYDRGVGTMQSLGGDLAHDSSLDEYLNAIVNSKGQVRSLLFFPGMQGTQSEEDINLEFEKTRGPHRASRLFTLFGPEGAEDQKPPTHIRLGMSPSDLEASQTRAGIRDDILRTNQVPPGAVGVGLDINRANAQVHLESLRRTVIYLLNETMNFHRWRYFEPLGHRPAEYFGEDRLFPMWDLDPLRDPETARILASRVPEFFNEKQVMTLSGFDGGDPEKRVQRSTVFVTGSEFNADPKAAAGEDRTGRQAFGREDEDQLE